MAWDKTNPASSSALVSSVIRDNWTAVETTLGGVNLLADPTFILWPFGDATAGPHWALAGTSAAIARAGTGLVDTSRKVGQFTAKVTSGSAALATLEQNLLTTVSYDDGFDGAYFSAGAWVRATQATTARIYLADGGVGSPTYSSYHSGGGAYEWLTVTRQIDTAATKIAFGLEVAAGTRVGYISGAVVVPGQIPPSGFVPPMVKLVTESKFISGAQTSGTDKVGLRHFRSRPFIVRDVMLSTQTAAPSTNALIVDVNHFTTAGAFVSMYASTGRPQVVTGANPGAPAPPDGTYQYRCFTAAGSATGTPMLYDAMLGFDIDQVGTSTAGTDLYVFYRLLEFTRPLELFLAATEIK